MKKYKQAHVFLTLLILTTSTIAFTNVAYAQDGTYTPQHLKLNNSAAEATLAKDYDKAIKLLNESLQLGEFNITYLNLGRTYALAGKCQQALEAYDKMLIAPRVSDYPPEMLYDKLVEYRADLKTQCPGKVNFRCQPKNIDITINGKDRQTCPSEPVELMPGEYTFEAYNADVHTKTQAEVIGQNIIYVDLVAVPKMISENIENQELDAVRSKLKVAGWTFTGIGIVALGIGSGILAHTETVLRDDYEKNKTTRKDEASKIAGTINERTFITYALFGVKKGLLIAGATILIIDAVSAPKKDEPKLSFGLAPNAATFKVKF